MHSVSNTSVSSTSSEINQKVAMREFQYDVAQLISCVRNRPCIWDESLHVYNDPLQRRSAWEEIFSTIEENYKDMPTEEQRWTKDSIIYKWTTLRDGFFRSLRTKFMKPRRPHMYDQLQFLCKNMSHVGCSECGFPTFAHKCCNCPSAFCACDCIFCPSDCRDVEPSNIKKKKSEKEKTSDDDTKPPSIKNKKSKDEDSSDYENIRHKKRKDDNDKKSLISKNHKRYEEDIDDFEKQLSARRKKYVENSDEDDRLSNTRKKKRREEDSDIDNNPPTARRDNRKEEDNYGDERKKRKYESEDYEKSQYVRNKNRNYQINDDDDKQLKKKTREDNDSDDDIDDVFIKELARKNDNLHSKPKEDLRKRDKNDGTITPKSKEISANPSAEDIHLQESDSKFMNEDEAFFASIIPTVRNYTEDEKLAFRMGVLAVMRKIKAYRK